MEPLWRVSDDGSFSIAGGGVTVGPCWPAVDGAGLRPVAVAIARGESIRVQYRLVGEASLIMEFGRDNEGLVLRTSLRGMTEAPRWIAPMAEAAVVGASRVARQGLGTGGPSGWRDIPANGEPWSWDGFLAAAFCTAAGATLAIAPQDQRRFLFRTTLTGRVRTKGLGGRAIERQEARLDCAFATERIALPDKVLVLPDLHVSAGPWPLAVLRKLAERIGARMQVRPAQEPGVLWRPNLSRGRAATHRELRNALVGAAGMAPVPPTRTVQIEDGYAPSPGDWLLPSAAFADGVQAALGDIATAGLRPGVWIAPFLIGGRSQVYRDHPEWIARQFDGAPVIVQRDRHGEDEVYALDLSHPGARDWLGSVFRTLRQWGARTFTTAHLDVGLVESTSIRRAASGRTSVEWLREACAAMRQGMGDDAIWCAADAPYAPLIGFADAMRVAADASGPWNAAHETLLNESHHAQWFNAIWWENAPGPVALRDRAGALTRNEMLGLAAWHGLLGAAVETGDTLAGDAERVRWLRFLRPGTRRRAAELPCWHHDRPTRVVVRHYGDHGAWGVLIHNPTDRALTDRLRLAEALGLERAVAFSWTPTGAERLGERTELVSDLPAHGSALYWISTRDVPPPREVSLGGAKD